MFKLRVISFAMVAFATVWNSPGTAEAGPLLDWFLGRRCCRQPLCQQQPVIAQAPCGTCQTTCMQTCQRTVVNYVPYTAYRTSWECVPVTTYRPQTNSDPCTGCTVTCMRPCTTYTYQAKQTPYTTYRPVYSTQAYQVPITYTSQLPAVQQFPVQAPIATGGCSSCGVSAMQQPIQYQPANTVPTITGTLDTGASYTTTPGFGAPTNGVQVPAETQPQLDPQLFQKPIIIEQTPTPAYGTSSRLNAPTNQQAWPSNSNLNPINVPGNGNQAPQLFDPEAKTAQAIQTNSTSTQSPVFQQFDYSPVRTASYSEPALYNSNRDQTQRFEAQTSSTEYAGSIQRSGASSSSAPKQLNQGWRSLAK